MSRTFAFTRSAGPIFPRLVMLLAATLGICGRASAVPIATPGYSVSTFATAAAGYSAPDSIAVDNGSVWVGYGNGLNGDGTIGTTTTIGTSTIVQYSTTGAVLNTYIVSGHNDGLKIDPTTHSVWALQNEDSNSNLVVINPTTHLQAQYNVGTGPHGGGYDDIVFLNGNVYFSASAPNFTGPINTLPVIVSAALNTTTHTVATTTILNSSASLNLTDPDSMIADPHGRLLLDGQSDSKLILLSNPGALNQVAMALSLSSPGISGVNVDDTLFTPTGATGCLLVTDRGANAVYCVHGALPGGAYSADPNGGQDFLASLNPDTGVLTPVVTNIAARSLAFLAVPEPGSWGLLSLGFVALISMTGVARRRRTAEC
jgi:hypothetical protein